MHTANSNWQDNIAEFHCWKTHSAAQSQVCASQADGKTKQSYASAISSTAHDATTDSSSNMHKSQTATAKQDHIT